MKTITSTHRTASGDHDASRRGAQARRYLAAAVALIVALFVAACGGRPGQPVETEAGPYTLTASLDPDPPQRSGGRFRLEVRDADGAPAPGVEVSVGYFMPAMGAMAEMKGKLDVAEKKGGVYLATLDLPMEGSWRIDVAVRADAGAALAVYNLTTGSRGLRLEESSPARPAAGATVAPMEIPRQEFPPPVLESLRTVFAAYEEVRQALAGDRLDDATSRARRVEASLTAAASGVAEGASKAILEEARRTAETLQQAGDLDAARGAFGELTRMLMVTANADGRLKEGRTVWSCPMTETFAKWIQVEGAKENPYMGRAMPGCGEVSDWTVSAPQKLQEILAHAEAAHRVEGEDGIAYYTCSMHPSVKYKDPGTCPICSMDLVPVTVEEIETGTIRIDSARRQEIGVRTEVVAPRRLAATVRAVGRVVYDETRLADVNLKIGGWIGRLEVDEPGQYVARGQTLFTLYSPELYAAQQELLTVLASQRAAANTAAPERADYLVEAARQRLRLWDLSAVQIDSLAETGKPLEYLPILSPVSGYVVEKNVVAGAAVEPGERLFRVAGLDRVWVDAEIYESELPLIERGQRAEVSLPYVPGRRFEGEVVFIYPYLEGTTRTGRVRIELPNPDLELKPDMYANVTIERDLGEQVSVPDEAVLYAGERSFVFLDLGDGRLQPRQVETGVTTGERIAVLSGLRPGDRVVTSGNFLVAAEARLKLALEQWK
ncbi:MAG: FixH family protein [Thermoanaerobaculia bacterium]